MASRDDVRQASRNRLGYLAKGSLVYIEGRIKTRKWIDKAGIEKYTTEIVCDTMKMLVGERKSKQEPNKPSATKVRLVI